MLICPYCSNVVPLMRSVRGHFKASHVSPLSIVVSTLCCSKPVRFTSKKVNIGLKEYPQYEHKLVMLAMPLEEAGEDFWGDDYTSVRSGEPKDDLMLQMTDLYGSYPYLYYTRAASPLDTRIYVGEGAEPILYRSLMRA